MTNHGIWHTLEIKSLNPGVGQAHADRTVTTDVLSSRRVETIPVTTLCCTFIRQAALYSSGETQKRAKPITGRTPDSTAEASSTCKPVPLLGGDPGLPEVERVLLYLARREQGGLCHRRPVASPQPPLGGVDLDSVMNQSVSFAVVAA